MLKVDLKASFHTFQSVLQLLKYSRKIENKELIFKILSFSKDFIPLFEDQYDVCLSIMDYSISFSKIYNLIEEKIEFFLITSNFILKKIEIDDKSALNKIQRAVLECSAATNLLKQTKNIENEEDRENMEQNLIKQKKISMLNNLAQKTMESLEDFFIIYIATNFSYSPLINNLPENLSVVYDDFEKILIHLSDRHKFDYVYQLFSLKLQNMFLQKDEIFHQKILKMINYNNQKQILQFEQPKNPKKTMFEVHRSSLKNIRDKIPSNIIIDENGILDVTRIFNIQMEINKGYKNIIRNIIHQALSICGPPPYQFCIIGLGSYGRSEVSPYSDFEFAILLENEENDDETSDKFSNTYFGKLVQVIEFIVSCIGEPTGFRVDSQGTPIEYRFRGSPSTIVNKAFKNFDTQGIPILFSLLQPVCLFTGGPKIYKNSSTEPSDQSLTQNNLFEQYQNLINEKLSNGFWKDQKIHISFSKYIFQEHIQMLASTQKWLNDLDNTEPEQVFIKNCFLAPLAHIVQDISLYYLTFKPTFFPPDVSVTNIIIDSLYLPSYKNITIFSKEFTDDFKKSWTVLNAIRIRLELKLGEQIEMIDNPVYLYQQNNTNLICLTKEESHWLQFIEFIIKRPLYSISDIIFESKSNEAINSPKEKQTNTFPRQNSSENNLKIEKKLESSQKTISFIKSSSISIFNPIDDSNLKDDDFLQKLPLDPAIFIMNKLLSHLKIGILTDLQKHKYSVISLAWTLFYRKSTRELHLFFYKQFPHLWRQFYYETILSLDKFNSTNTIQILDEIEGCSNQSELSNRNYKKWVDEIKIDISENLVSEIQKYITKVNLDEFSDRANSNDHLNIFKHKSDVIEDNKFQNDIISIKTSKNEYIFSSSNRFSQDISSSILLKRLMDGVSFMEIQKIVLQKDLLGSLNQISKKSGLNIESSFFNGNSSLVTTLVIERISGTSLKDILERQEPILLNKRSYTEALFASLLIPIETKASDIIIIDGEIGKNFFVAKHRNNLEFIFFENTKIEKSNIYVNKNILFCLDQLLDYVDENFVSEFINLDPTSILSAWGKELEFLENNLKKGFFSNDLTLFENLGNEHFFSISTTWLEDFYNNMIRIQSILKEEPKITHKKLLDSIFPVMAYIVDKAHKKSSNSLERFEILGMRFPVSYFYNKFSNSSDILNNHTRIHLKLSQIDEELENLLKESLVLKDVKSFVLNLFDKNSNCEQIFSNSRFRIQLFNSINHNELSIKVQTYLLNTIINSIQKLSEIIIKNSQLFDKNFSENIFKNNYPHITHLNLSGCSKIENRVIGSGDIVKLISENLPNLIFLDLSLTSIKYIAISQITTTIEINFNKLEWLVLDQCKLLQKIKITAPSLWNIDCRDCPELNRLEVRLADKATANLKGSSKFYCSSLFLIAGLKYSKEISFLSLNIKKFQDIADSLDYILKTTVVTKLELNSKHIPLEIIRIISIVIIHSTVMELLIDNCEINEEGIKIIYDAILEKKRLLIFHPMFEIDNQSISWPPANSSFKLTLLKTKASHSFMEELSSNASLYSINFKHD